MPFDGSILELREPHFFSDRLQVWPGTLIIHKADLTENTAGAAELRFLLAKNYNWQAFGKHFSIVLGQFYRFFTSFF